MTLQGLPTGRKAPLVAFLMRSKMITVKPCLSSLSLHLVSWSCRYLDALFGATVSPC